MRKIETMVSLSLVSYTYNDEKLARELLEHVRTWTIQPDEIIVVDDCSSEPFHPGETAPAARVLRLPENLGPTGAKTAGLGAAKKKILLSVDCDTRLPPQWIARCLPLLRDASVGLVSSHILCESGSDDLSRYVDRRYSFRPAPGETPFVPGCVFLMRRSAYEDCGGFAGHTSRINDDVYLCQALRRKGYVLRIAPDLEARQVRRLSLVACIRRAFTWDMPYFSRNLAENKPFSELFATFLMGVKLKMENTPVQEKHLHYFDLLYLLYGAMGLAQKQRQMEGAQAAVWRTFAHILAPWPRLWEQVNADMRRFFPEFDFEEARTAGGFFQGAETVVGLSFTPDLLKFLDAYLSEKGMSETVDAHFSLYETRGECVM